MRMQTSPPFLMACAGSAGRVSSTAVGNGGSGVPQQRHDQPGILQTAWDL